MAHVYRVEGSFDSIAIAGPAQSATENGTQDSIFISVYDDTNEWAIEARRAWHAYSSGPVIYEYRAEFYFYFLVGFGDPGGGSFVAGTFSLVDADGNNGAPISSGFTMAIEKDEAADQLRFVTPLGTVTHSLSGFGALDASKLRLLCVAHQFARSNTGANSSDSFDWYNIYSKEDGTSFRGTALSTTAPGIWSDWVEVIFGFPTGPIANYTTTQGATRYTTAFTYVGADAPRSIGSRIWREWLGGDTVDAGPGTTLSEMAWLKEHGPLVAAAILSPTTVSWERSYNRGVDWESGTIHVGTAPANISLQWYRHRLISLWEDAGSIVQALSYDLGTTWESAVPLSLTGTNPKLLIDPDSGTAFYFYMNGSDLHLKRSGTLGADFIDAVQIVVAASIDVQTITAQFASDKSIVVGYIASGSWEQRRSRDWGETWA